MRSLNLHPWTTDPAEAVRLQSELRQHVIKQNVPPELSDPSSGVVRRIAGCDISFKDEIGCGTIVIINFPELVPLHVVKVEVPLTMPYIPGLLSFRETPVYLAAFEQLPPEYEPDLLVLDGQGYAHPRRFGIACHMGLLFDKPAIGCAKSRLTGSYTEPESQAGAYADLLDRGELIGSVLRTKTAVSPIYVSLGHKIDLATARMYLLRCTAGYRIPEPTRLAHLAAAGNDVLKPRKPQAAQQSFLDMM